MQHFSVQNVTFCVFKGFGVSRGCNRCFKKFEGDRHKILC